MFAFTIESIPSASAGVVESDLAGDECQGARRRVLVEPHPPAEEELRVEAAEEEVRVGHGRLRPAAAVASGAGIRAGALRPDSQAAGLEPRERAAARADGVDVDQGHEDRQALELGLGRDGRAAVDDQAEVERGAAHVDAEQVRSTGCARESGAADRSPDRTGEERLHGLLGAPWRRS